MSDSCRLPSNKLILVNVAGTPAARVYEEIADARPSLCPNQACGFGKGLIPRVRGNERAIFSQARARACGSKRPIGASRSGLRQIVVRFAADAAGGKDGVGAASGGLNRRDGRPGGDLP